MPPQRVFSLPRQQSLLLPAVINPFVQDTTLTKAAIIKVSMSSGLHWSCEGELLRDDVHGRCFEQQQGSHAVSARPDLRLHTQTAATVKPRPIISCNRGFHNRLARLRYVQPNNETRCVLSRKPPGDVDFLSRAYFY